MCCTAKLPISGAGVASYLTHHKILHLEKKRGVHVGFAWVEGPREEGAKITVV